MFTAGFGQTQGKPTHIVDEHNFFSVRGTDSRHRSEQIPGVSQSQSIRMRGGLSNCFVEGDLLKATNIYQQFDRKGNVYENRLYAKTSINQAKLNKQQASFVRKMDDMPDEVCRIQNGTMTVSAPDEHMYRTMGTNKSNNGGAAFSAVSGPRSQQSQSVSGMGKSAQVPSGVSSPGLAGGQKSMKNRTTGRFRGTSQRESERCTFSRAGGPRIDRADMTSNPIKPYRD